MQRLGILHPSRRRLLAWLEHDDGVASNAGDLDAVNDHVEQCERCATRLEDLSSGADEPAEFAEELGAALRQVYEPPPGINDRVMKKIDERERADREISLFLGLFAIATDTADLMLPDDSPGSNNGGDRRNREEET